MSNSFQRIFDRAAKELQLMRASMIYRYQSDSFKKESDSNLKNFPAFLHVLIPEGGNTTASGSSASAASAGGAGAAAGAAGAAGGVAAAGAPASSAAATAAAVAAAADKSIQNAELIKIDEQTKMLMEQLQQMSKRLDDLVKSKQ